MKKKLLKITYNFALILLISLISTIEQLDLNNLELNKIPMIFLGVAFGATIKFVLKPFLLELLFKKKDQKEDQKETKESEEKKSS